jgi:hypothetical protein
MARPSHYSFIKLAFSCLILTFFFHPFFSFQSFEYICRGFEPQNSSFPKLIGYELAFSYLFLSPETWKISEN